LKYALKTAHRLTVSTGTVWVSEHGSEIILPGWKDHKNPVAFQNAFDYICMLVAPGLMAVVEHIHPLPNETHYRGSLK
jgi:hypothetical protein